MNEELKPCPHCPSLYARSYNDEETYYVFCLNCHARGADCDTEAEAIAAWNTRPIEDGLRNTVEILSNTILTDTVVMERLKGEVNALHVWISNALAFLRSVPAEELCCPGELEQRDKLVMSAGAKE